MSSNESNVHRRPEYLKAVIDILAEQGGEMRSRDVLKEVERRLQPTTYESDHLERTGYVRWEAALQLDTIRLVKAGWLRKRRGVWVLTDEGQKKASLPADELVREAGARYHEWKRAQPDTEVPESVDDSAVDTEDLPMAARFDQAAELARSSIEDFVNEMEAYDFQDLVAALLRGMAYYTPFVATPGKDGGIDILAYRDPFGTVEPRIKVQVKHRQSNKVSSPEVRALKSVLNKQGERGFSSQRAGLRQTQWLKCDIRRFISRQWT